MKASFNKNVISPGKICIIPLDKAAGMGQAYNNVNQGIVVA